MEYRFLGKTGLKVSAIGFGGIPIQRTGINEAVETIRQALEVGINFFDTARGYSDSEKKLGLALSDRRSRVILATKSMARDRAALIREVEQSLRDLRTDYIDLYQLHNLRSREVLDKVFGPGGALEGLEEARREGKVRYIGVTGHIPALLAEALRRHSFDTVQFPFNAVELEAQEELLPLAQKMGVGTIAMKPLAGGVISSRKAALKFLLQQPLSTIIPGMQSRAEVLENAALPGEDLSPGEREELLAEVKTLGSRFCRRCEYCRPCPQGLDITFNMLMLGYAKNYGLQEWATDRYHHQKIKADACVECGQCEEKCPYDLPIRDLLKECRLLFGD